MSLNVNIADALGAYGRVKTQQNGAAKAPLSNPGATATPGFADVVGDMLSNTAGKLQQAEQASSLHLAGRGNMIDIVTAIGAAETALDTMVAVRDRVVNAYGEIMRMQV